jgi:outer membrane lipoprotein SlyB
VGTAVGGFVGDPLGGLVGESVGPFVGRAVGPFVGRLVGGSVGGLVGRKVGPFVGGAVGRLVGNLVGSLVGGTVGGFVGRVLGWSVGSFVGTTVGVLVGGIVGSCVGVLVGEIVGGCVDVLVGGIVGVLDNLEESIISSSGEPVGSYPADCVRLVLVTAYSVVNTTVPSCPRTFIQSTQVSIIPEPEESGTSLQPICSSKVKTLSDSTCKRRDPATVTSAALVLLSQNSGSLLQQPTQ